jgi:hypothetical protein
LGNGHCAERTKPGAHGQNANDSDPVFGNLGGNKEGVDVAIAAECVNCQKVLAQFRFNLPDRRVTCSFLFPEKVLDFRKDV